MAIGSFSIGFRLVLGTVESLCQNNRERIFGVTLWAQTHKCNFFSSSIISRQFATQNHFLIHANVLWENASPSLLIHAPVRHLTHSRCELVEGMALELHTSVNSSRKWKAWAGTEIYWMIEYIRQAMQFLCGNHGFSISFMARHLGLKQKIPWRLVQNLGRTLRIPGRMRLKNIFLFLDSGWWYYIDLSNVIQEEIKMILIFKLFGHYCKSTIKQLPSACDVKSKHSFFGVTSTICSQVNSVQVSWRINNMDK